VGKKELNDLLSSGGRGLFFYDYFDRFVEFKRESDSPWKN
jgi:hypothetical protein